MRHKKTQCNGNKAMSWNSFGNEWRWRWLQDLQINIQPLRMKYLWFCKMEMFQTWKEADREIKLLKVCVEACRVKSMRNRNNPIRKATEARYLLQPKVQSMLEHLSWQPEMCKNQTEAVTFRCSESRFFKFSANHTFNSIPYIHMIECIHLKAGFNVKNRFVR